MSDAPGLGVATVDRDLTIQSWNHWLTEATGVPEADALGRPLVSLVPPERADLLRSLLLEVLMSGTSRVLAPAFHRYLIACPPQFNSRHFDRMQQLVTIAPLRSDAAIAGAIVTVEDVTERLERERALTAALETAAPGLAPAAALEAVGAADWRLRGAAVRTLRQRASPDEIAHLLEALQRGYHDLNVVSSALQVLIAANRDIMSPLIDLLSDPNPDLRMHAALALGRVGDEAAVPALVRALADDDTNVRFHTIEALGQLAAAEAVEPLATIARSGDFFLSFAAIDALAKTDDPRVVPALAALLDNASLRPAVIEALAALGDEDSVEPLAAVLEQDGDDIGAAADALARIHARYEDTFAAGQHIADLTRRAMTPQAIERLGDAVTRRQAPLPALVTVLGWTGAAGLPALLSVLGVAAVDAPLATAIRALGRDAVLPLIDRLEEGERDARLAAASLLGGVGDRRAVAPLVAALSAADAELSARAAAALARLGDAAALDALLSLFAHPQPMVRQAAVAAVNSIGAEETRARVLERLHDSNPHVRISAIRVAGYFGFDESVSEIFGALVDPEEEVRRAAIEQLPMVDDPRAVAHLIAALRAETPRNRGAAAHALRLVNGTAVIEPLVDALNDSDVWVRYFAAGSAGRRRDAEAAGALTRLAQADGAPHVRIAAIEALTAIDPEIASEVSAPLVHDPDQEVACAALASLAGGGDGAADLLERAVRSGDASLCRSAVQALGSRPSSRSTEMLAWAARIADPPDGPRLAIEALGRIAAEPAVRGAALHALIELGSTAGTRELIVATLAALPRDAIVDLAAALSVTRGDGRLTIVEALARMRDPRASEALASALRDPDAGVRRAAVGAFGRLGTPAVAAAVTALMQHDPDGAVRRLAAAVCRRHGWVSGPPGIGR